MIQPGRNFFTVTRYRYGFIGQEKSGELGESAYTAEFWQYDARIGKRWNIDPKPSTIGSSYLTLQGNPIRFSDPYGDTSILSLEGKMRDVGDLDYETYDGRAVTVGNIVIQPMKGALKSITFKGDRVVDGSAKFVAVFNKKSGKFIEYAWDKDFSYSLEDFYNDARKGLLQELEHEGDPMWDPELPGDQAGRRALALGTGLAVPQPVLKATTSAANASKVTTTVLGKYPDYLSLASKLKANVFNIPTKIWNRMSTSQQWAANKSFLDEAIARGDKILLSNQVKDIKNVSGAFRAELDYLIEKGYKLTADGTQMIK